MVQVPLSGQAHSPLRMQELRPHDSGGSSSPPRVLHLLCLHPFRDTSFGFRGRLRGFQRKLKGLARLTFLDGPFPLAFYRSDNFSGPVIDVRVKKAWLVSTDSVYHAAPGDEVDGRWRPKPVGCDSFQYQNQVAGLEESLAYISQHILINRPNDGFDGVIGFSQGAAMAAAVAMAQWQGRFEDAFQFRCFMFFSGYPLPELLNGRSPEKHGEVIDLPSLHVFGSAERDLQIPVEASKSLASLFQNSVVHMHSYGHMIPIGEENVSVYRDFLSRFTSR